MITGRIEEDIPLITISLGWFSGVKKITAIVDTGFSGDLKIPPSLAQELNIEASYTEVLVLADDRKINIPVGLALASIEGEHKIVSALIGEGVSLIGVRMLKKFGMKLIADFKKETLTLESS